ncbi:MAG: precorrin-8X methylmutase, partial [Nitrospirae bacterium]
MNKGRTIERESFRIIDEEMKRRFPPDQHSIVRRVIHATGDFEFEDIIRFHHDAVSAGLEAIRCGRKVLVDVKMVSAGINPKRLKKHSSGVLCFISDEDVIERSESGYGTRAEIAIEKAAALYGNEIGIVAIGNAPTALLKVMELKDKELFDPSLIVGVPVG